MFTQVLKPYFMSRVEKRFTLQAASAWQVYEINLWGIQGHDLVYTEQNMDTLLHPWAPFTAA